MSRPDDIETVKQTDALLWIGGALIVVVGLIWVAISQPWTGDAAFDIADSAAGNVQAELAAGSDAVSPATGGAVPTARTETRPSAEPGREVGPGGSAEAGSAASRSAEVEADSGAALDVGAEQRNGGESSAESESLRMAELAFDAGMLVEPEEYSAWALYLRALEQHPESNDARRGLAMVADELLRRGRVAADQGRLEDAQATVERIRAALPAHAGAEELADRIESLEASRREAALARARPPPAAPVEAEQAPSEPSVPAVPETDPLEAPYAAFQAALAGNDLLTPAGRSAKHHVDVLTALDPDHELARAARTRLSNRFVEHARAAIGELDWTAAETWLDEADALGTNADSILSARRELRQRQIWAESRRPLPASTLNALSSPAPIYPQRALERGIEGWVDIEFTVTRDGATRDHVVTDASTRDAGFRQEAVNAVERWIFEPRTFLGEPIEQRVYTRIRFVLD